MKVESMSDKTFSSGDLVYDKYGSAYQYVSVHPSGYGHICLPWFESCDSDGAPSNWTGDPETIREVFAEAVQPIQKSAETLAELTAKCDAVRLELAGLIKERATFDSEVRARSERIKRHDKLRLLDDYLAGKITHFVVAPQYYTTVEVQSVADALKQNEKYASGIKLLTLYGDSKGDIQFRINSYSDGSGNSFSGDAYPFTSEEDANLFAKELVAKSLADCISGEHGLNGAGLPPTLEGWIKTADKYGVPVPNEWRGKIKAFRVECLKKSISDLQQKIDEANKAIESEANTPSATPPVAE